jgi:hypothetical protein
MADIFNHASLLFALEFRFLSVLMPDDRATTRREDPASEATLREYQIDIFELETLCLWVEEIDYWNPEEVENGEDDEDAPADVFCARFVSPAYVKKMRFGQAQSK